MPSSGSGSNRLTRGGPSSLNDDVQVLDFAEPPDGFRRRTRVLKSGVERHKYTVEIESEPIVFDLAELRLGKGPAEAIREEMIADFNRITERASPATIDKRERAKVALAAGKRWAVKRYSGGRTGTTPPSGSIRKLIDSGRLKNGIFVRENRSDESWTVNVPANRLKQEDFTPSAWRQFLLDFKRLIPSMNARELLRRPAFNRAIDEAIADAIQKATDRGRDLRRANLRAAAGLLGQVGRLVLG